MKGEKTVKKIISLILSLLIIISCLPVVSFAKVSDNAYDADGKYIYRNDTYDFPMLGDPQRLPDEEFFGKWDAENEVWEIPSYFKYDTDPDAFPEFKPVMEAVKSGDYELAKQELMDYYTPKKYNYTTRSTSISENARVQSEFIIRNFYAVNTQNGISRGIAQVNSTEWEEVEVDMKDTVNSMLSDKQKEITIVVMSMDKSNTPAEIKAYESGEVPTITLVVNGTPRIFPVTEDSYIRAGDYADISYGGSDVLYVQEYGYEGHWDSNNLSADDQEQLGKADNDWGSEASPTRRAYMKFDLSSITVNDEISSATLNFTARVSPGEEYDLTAKELAIYHWSDNNWNEKTLCWNTFTDWLAFSVNEQDVWDYITTSSTTTKGKICYFHRGNAINMLAACYDVTGDEKYAYTFLRNQMGLINSIGVNSEVMNCLDMSGHVSRWGVNGFVKLWGSKTMTPEIFTAVLKHYVEMTNLIDVSWVQTKRFTNNWATYATGAMYQMSTMYPELDYSDSWIETVKADNRGLLLGGEERYSGWHEGQVLRDGMCIELGRGYVFTLLGTYSSSLQFQQRSGGVMPFDEEGLELMKSIVKNVLYQSAPGYYGFNMGDSMDYSDNSVSSLTTWYKLLLYDDPEMEYVATNGSSGRLPEFTSISYPYGLRTYMRSGWGDNDISLCFTGTCEGSHGHADVLSFSLWGYGQFLLTDQSYGSTQTGDIMDFMKSAQQHNLITINGGNCPKGAEGKNSIEEQQELNDLYNFTTYSNAFFDGADYNQRSVMFLKNQEFFIINDYVIPENKEEITTYTQFWHMLPSSGIHITDDGKKQIKSNFADTANVIVAGADMDDIYDIYLEDSIFSPSDGAFIAAKKGVYEKRAIGEVSYTTVVYPVDKGNDYDVKTAMIDTGIADNKASAMWIKITNNNSGEFSNYYYYHLNDYTAKQEVKIGEYTTDAEALLIEEDEKSDAVSVFIYNGTYIKSPFYADGYLFKSETPKTLGYKLNGSSMVEISTDKVINDPDNLRTAFTEEDLKDLTIYVGTSSKGAMYNTNAVSGTSKSGGYLYFGDEPIVVGTEKEGTNTDKEDNKGSHGVGGGGGGGGAAVVPPVVEPPVVEPPIAEPPVDIKPVVSYTDVNENDWYYSYVTELTEKEIVSGDGTGYFNPADNVTREQFLKMLVEATDIETEEAENTFADVLSDEWYKPYVLKAKKFGIVTGISKTEFGIGSNITRQDMAVMITRTIEKLGIETETEKAEAFADNDKVSDYAKDAVMFMKSIGLIEGYNNEFRPLDELTRAEASKIIFELMKLTNIK